MTLSAQHFADLVDRDRLTSRLEQLVRIPSENPPGLEAEAARVVGGFCAELGLTVTEHETEPGRPSVIARAGNGNPVLCYCSHIDVVPAGDPTLWDVDPYGAVVKDGLMFGRGSSDAKGPIAAALEAVELLKASDVDISGLELALVADEEAMGLKGAKPLVDEGIVTAKNVIVGEPTSLRIVRAQRGPCWFRIIVRGVAGHGSAPERGRNAIRHMAAIILRLEETVPDITHEVLGGPSINVGTITGGEKVNVIPASCIAEVDRRTIPGETEADVRAQVERSIELARETFPDIDASIEIPVFGQPFEAAEGARVVSTMTQAVTDAQQAEAEVIGFRGSSDARFFADGGAEVCVCGPGDITVAHTAREYIDLDELARGAVAYACAFDRLLAPG
ncbi:MAG TPA: M20 family metallopeptidase [Actinomycetota bacterium]|nr:M20 family metallopeptidase [Actinomycetota bacterium]